MRNKNEKGEVVVEASIIVTLVVVLITLMLYVGMVLYQKTLITVMANQTASNIAQVYSNNLKDPFTGYVDPDKVYQSITYSNLKTDAYMDVLNQKANVLGQYRLKSSRILATGTTSVDVDIVKKPNELLKSQIVVTIHDQYDIPLVGMFGVNNGLVKFSATGRADCVDVLEYINGVEAISGKPEPNDEEGGLGVVPSLSDSDTCLVTFVVDKYTGGFHATVPVLRGKSILSSNHFSHCEMPDNPRYGKLKFNGWVMEDGTTFTASRQVDADITVYGAWLCKVTFNPDGGEVKPRSKEVPYKNTIKFPVPTKEGYAFEGWYTQKDGGGEPYYSNVTEITGNITLYAKWRCVHEFKGRCGVPHDLGDDAYEMTLHEGKGSGYECSTIAECIVCVRCGAPYNEEWVTRNGQTVASGMYCIEHKFNGKKEKDTAYEKQGYSEREIVPVH